MEPQTAALGASKLHGQYYYSLTVEQIKPESLTPVSNVICPCCSFVPTRAHTERSGATTHDYMKSEGECLEYCNWIQVHNDLSKAYTCLLHIDRTTAETKKKDVG